MAPRGGRRFTPVELLGCPSAPAPEGWAEYGLMAVAGEQLYLLESLRSGRIPWAGGTGSVAKIPLMTLDVSGFFSFLSPPPLL